MLAVSSRDLDDLRALPTQEERRHAFRRLALRCHPDKVAITEEKGEATRLFQELLAVRDADENEDPAMVQPEESPASSCRLRAFPQRDVVHGVAFAPGGRKVAACGDSGRLMLWSAKDGVAEEGWCFAQQDAELEDGTGTALAVVFLDEEHLAVASGTAVVIWGLDGVSSSPKSRLDVEARVLSLAVDSQKRRLAAGSEAGSVLTWRWQEGHERYRLEATLKHDPIVECLVLGGQGGTLLLTAGGASVLLWRHCNYSGRWKACARLGSDWRCPEFIYSVDAVGSIIAAGGTGAAVPVWSRMANVPTQTHDNVDKDDEEEESAERSGTRSTWSSSGDSDEGDGEQDDEEDEDEQPFVLEQDGESQSPDFFVSHSEDDGRVSVNAVSICPAARMLATGGSDCRIVIWQLQEGQPNALATFVHRLPPGQHCNLATATINHLRISPDGAVMAAGGYDMMLSLWRLPRPATIQDHDEEHIGPLREAGPDPNYQVAS